MQARAQKLLPLFIIAAGTLLGWFGAEASQTLAWILVTGGLGGAVLDLLLSPRLSTATCETGLAHALAAADAESWSHSVAIIAADALADSGVMQTRHKARAAEIIGEEIAVRLSIGDQPAQTSDSSDDRVGA